MTNRPKICLDRVLPRDLMSLQPTTRAGGRPRAITPIGKTWMNGSGLQVRFMGGTAAQKNTVRTGEADAGIVYITDMKSAGPSASSVAVPATQNVQATLPAAVVKETRYETAAKALVAWLASADATAVFAKYGVHAKQYADFAVLRGDPSDGLPGVSGIGEKSAAALLTACGDLDGIRAGVLEGTAGTPAQRAKIAAAADYLEVAPTVVRVARELDLEPFDDRLGPVDRSAAEELAERWNLGSSMTTPTRLSPGAGRLPGPPSAPRFRPRAGSPATP